MAGKTGVNPNPFSAYTGGNYYDPGNLTTKGGLKNATGQLFGENSLLQAGTNAQRGSEFGTLMPGYQSLLNSGYSPQEKSGIEQGTLGAIQGSYGSATDAAARRMARTNNSAGYGSFLGAAARSKGRDLAQQELDNQKLFADESLRRKLIGLEGIGKLYGLDTSFLDSLGSKQLGVLGVGQAVQSGRKGVLGNIQAAGNAFSSFF